MASHHRHRVLYIILSLLLLVIIGAGGFAFWLSGHYKQIIKDKLPGIVMDATDSVYHISYTDVNVNMYTHRVTIINVKLWPDMEQVKALRKAHRHVPTTLHTLTMPELEAYNVSWKALADSKTIYCDYATVKGMKWIMVCAPRPKDSLFTRDPSRKPKIERIACAHIDVTDPNITYHFEGKSDSFYCFMKGGTASLHDWSYNMDAKRDTNTFLYAHSGVVRFDSFILLKPAGRYGVKKPIIDFESDANSVTLKNVKLNNLVDHDVHNGKEKEKYHITLPSVKLTGFNWNRLVNENELIVPEINAPDANIEMTYIRANSDNSAKISSYPSQLLLQVGIHTDVHLLTMENAHLKYTEVGGGKDSAGIIEFTHIKGRFSNITNIKDVIKHDPDCVIKLAGKFSNKSPVDATFIFRLTDTTGHFIMKGNLENLDGDDVIKQVQAFTFVEVTSFHLSRIDMHVEGDDHYGKGDFTMLYKDLKISLLKFNSKYRKGKHGPLSFLGSALILYPSNPMPNGDVRKVSTFFDRSPQKGFIGLIWQNIYRGAKKTAVRHEGIINLTDGKEDTPGQPPRKKSFIRRLFSKKKK